MPTPSPLPVDGMPIDQAPRPCVKATTVVFAVSRARFTTAVLGKPPVNWVQVQLVEVFVSFVKNTARSEPRTITRPVPLWYSTTESTGIAGSDVPILVQLVPPSLLFQI